MREIKFRAWDKKEKKMFLVENLYFFHEDFGVGECKKGDIFLSRRETSPLGKVGKDFELMQFTGLLDKNGKEIYEGDIIGKEMGSLYGKVSVFWDQNLSGWHPFNDPAYIAITDGEVIGNIYEHPQLLRKK